MKRDLELIRALLLAMEEGPKRNKNPEIPGYTDAEVGYHAYLLQDAGYITAANATTQGSQGPYWVALNLTWAGHDYLTAVRDDTVWAAVKRRAGQHLPSLTLDVVKALGVDAVKQLIGLPPT